MLAGTTGEGAADRAVVRLADGTEIDSPIGTATEISPLGFFVLTIPAGADARQVYLLNAGGDVVDTRSTEE